MICPVCRRQIEAVGGPTCGACGHLRRLDPSARVLSSNIQELTRQKRNAVNRAYHARKKARA